MRVITVAAYPGGCTAISMPHRGKLSGGADLLPRRTYTRLLRPGDNFDIVTQRLEDRRIHRPGKALSCGITTSLLYAHRGCSTADRRSRCRDSLARAWCPLANTIWDRIPAAAQG